MPRLDDDDRRLCAILLRCTGRKDHEIERSVGELVDLQRQCVRQNERAVSDPSYSNRYHEKLKRQVGAAVDVLFKGVDRAAWGVIWNDNGVSPAFYLKLPTGENNSFDGKGWIVGDCP